MNVFGTIDVGKAVAESVLSGLYVRRAPLFTRQGFRPAVVDVVRFDVDGIYRQMTASGTYYPNGSS